MANGENLDTFTLKMQANKPNLKANLADIQFNANYGDRSEDKTITNGGKSSIRLTNETVTSAASPNTSFKMSKNQTISQAFEERHISNRIKYECYEIMVNGHKLNPNFWEYSDFKKYTDPYGDIHAVGRFAVDGTILTPTWDEQQHKYVLIRRRARMTMFSPKNNVPEILNTLSIEDPTKVVFNYGTKTKTQTAEEYYNSIGKLFDDKEYDNGNHSGSGNGQCSSDMEKVISIALELGSQGIPYVWGGKDPSGFDCTGFVSYCMNKAGFDIEPCGGSGFDDNVKALGFDVIAFSESAMQRGDILSSPTHVEIYLGNGRMVGAHSKKNGVNEKDYSDTTGFNEIFRCPTSKDDDKDKDKDKNNKDGK